MSREREIDDSELMDVAQDPEQAHRLHKALRTMAGNPAVGGALQEMAQEVLSGRMGMRDVLQTDRYMDAIGSRMTEIRRTAEDQTLEERKASHERFERWQEERAAEADRERAERDGPTQPFPNPKRPGGNHRP